jgi:queuine tRNA-ribosyltransferase
VWPCRTARFGTAIVPNGLLKLSKLQHAKDLRPLDAECPCIVCQKPYSRAYLSTIAGREPLGCHLLTIHNTQQMMTLMTRMRESILEQRFPAFVQQFMKLHFPKPDTYPRWIVEALDAVGITLLK